MYITVPQILWSILCTSIIFQLPIYDPILHQRKSGKEAHVICHLEETTDYTPCSMNSTDYTLITSVIECQFTARKAPALIFNYSEYSIYQTEKEANKHMSHSLATWTPYAFRYYYGDEDLTEEKIDGLVDQWGLSHAPLSPSPHYYHTYYVIIGVLLTYFTLLFILWNSINDNTDQELRILKYTISNEEKAVS